MKKLFTAPSLITCDMLHSLLDSEGIPCVLKNEGGSAMTGTSLPIPGASEMAWAWPEVWVNDEDFDVASEIAAEFQRSLSQREKQQAPDSENDYGPSDPITPI
jgi:hypothetical protein